MRRPTEHDDPGTPARGEAPATHPGVQDRLFEITYDELRAIAQRFLAHERPGHTLQPTALVNEAYLKLRNQDGFRTLDPAEFRARAAGAMRLVLIDSARRHRAAKRPRSRVEVSLDSLASPGATIDLEACMALHDALERLAERRPNGPRHARLIEHVWFGGLSLVQAAGALGISRRQAQRDWAWARVWLRSELGV